jgi:hypothetical protein
MNETYIFTTASPSHDEAMKRYEEQVAVCADFDPPLTVKERKHILDSCLAGFPIILRCWFYNDEKPGIMFGLSSGDEGSK